MREQKYADILKKYEDENRTIEEAEIETFEKETEEKLSMTRELKFKDLQAHIDKSFMKEIEVEDVSDVNEVNQEDEQLSEQESLDKRFVDFIEETGHSSSIVDDELEETLVDEENKNDTLNENHKQEEDIYLTTSFKPLKKRFRIKKVFKVLFILMILAFLIGTIFYFVLMPLYKKIEDSKPKVIFDSSVEFLSKEMINFVERYYDDNDGIIYGDYNFKIDSNIDKFGLLTNDTFGFSYGIDVKNKTFENYIYIKSGNELHGIKQVEKGDSYYNNFSTSSKYLKIAKTKEDKNDNSYAELQKYLEKVGKVSKDDFIYLINTQSNLLKEMLESNLIHASKDEIEINGESRKVVKNSYVLDYKDADRINKKYVENVLKDKKLVKILANINNQSIQEFEKKFKAEYLEDLDVDYKMIMNIYTVNGTEVVGFDVEENGFREIYYYKNDISFEFYLNMTTDEECLNGQDCVLDNQKIISMVGTKKDKSTEVIVNYNKEKIIKLDVFDLSYDKIDVDYEINYGSLKYNGDVLFLLNDKEKEYNLNLNIKADEEYLNINLFMDFKANAEIGQIDPNNIFNYSDKVFKEESKLFTEKLDSIGLLDKYMAWYDLIVESNESVKKESDKEIA